MSVEKTLSIIKPDAVKKNVIGEIYTRFEKKGLKPIDIISKKSDIHKTVKTGSGFISLPKSYVNRGSVIGDYTILNTGSMIDHECKIGNGVHLMGGCYLAGRVTVDDFASIGATATIFTSSGPGQSLGVLYSGVG